LSKERKGELSWYQAVAERIAREGMTPREAAAAEYVQLSTQELENTVRSKSFQRVLWQARQRFYRELANDPERSKNTLIGLMLLSLDRLADEGAWDKVADAALKLARVEGWLSGETNVNVFGSLSARELADIKASVKARSETVGPN